MKYRNVLDFCESLPQRQDSLNDQLNDLMRVGNKMGLYDAVTFVKELEEHLSRIASIANDGGLRGYPSEHDALVAIRRMSLKYCGRFKRQDAK